MTRAQSVSELNEKIKSLMEATFLDVCVEGEVSNLTRHNSGHYYFSIKDEQSTLRCVMFRQYVSRLKFNLQNNQKVIVSGNLSVYTPRGEYQMLCVDMVLSGRGAEEFEALKIKLEKKGYFENKKPLPEFPKKIALITSNTGAALQDMLSVADKRWGGVKLVNYDTLVQGQDAGEQIARNIALADSLFGTPEAFDVIVIGRGGGSMEDLWAFNEEIVAEAIFKARTPIVSAVGHEIDYVISDYVADKRAPTPSAAMEMILPDRQTWLLHLDELSQSAERALAHFLDRLKLRLENLSLLLSRYNLEHQLMLQNKILEDLSMLLRAYFEQFLQFKKWHLASLDLRRGFQGFLDQKFLVMQGLESQLKAKDLTKLCKNGYAQILKNNQVAEAQNLKVGDEISLLTTQVQVRVEVKEIVKINKL